jgi:hypothetical protein
MHFGFSCSTALMIRAVSREKSGSLGTTTRNGEWHIKSGSEMTEGLKNKTTEGLMHTKLGGHSKSATFDGKCSID